MRRVSQTTLKPKPNRLSVVLKQISKTIKTYRKTFIVFEVGLVFALFWVTAWHNLDPDFGWHLTTGNYIRQHGIPSHDLYTYTAQNFRWIDHEWGNDVLVSLLYSVGGYALLSVVFSVIWTAAIFISAGTKTRLIFLLIAVRAILTYSGIRPIAWTMLFLAILLKMTASKSKYVRASIPLLFLVWANLHAGFTVGLVLLIILWISDRKKSWLYIFLASTLLTFINPYGPRLYVEIFRTLTDSKLHTQVQEWFPFSMTAIAWTFIALWTAGFWLFSRKKFRDWFNLRTFLYLSAMSASRNVPLFVNTSIRDLDKYLDDARKTLPKILDKRTKLIIYIFVASVLGILTYSYRNVVHSLSVDRTSDYPVAAVQYLSVHPCSGNLFNDYDFGGYLIWKLPSQPVFIDGRMPSWRNSSGQRYMDIYIDTLKNKSEQNKEFKLYNVQCALLKAKVNDAIMIKRLVHSNWKLVVQSNNSYLFLAPKK